TQAALSPNRQTSLPASLSNSHAYRTSPAKTAPANFQTAAKRPSTQPPAQVPISPAQGRSTPRPTPASSSAHASENSQDPWKHRVGPPGPAHSKPPANSTTRSRWTSPPPESKPAAAPPAPSASRVSETMAGSDPSAPPRPAAACVAQTQKAPRRPAEKS